ncbi:ketohexokinase isoform X2 [Temnothorax nylanderi]|uniref:ketohexokinase isoform X2 n=1 Tax=Temnothorax nylanderi TaxID=102681 RepID=UPI003A885CD9
MTSSFDKVISGTSSTEARTLKILCVGRVCLDIIQTCVQYPSEDSTQRSTDYRWQRGGNASNTCTVLSLIGQPCSGCPVATVILNSSNGSRTCVYHNQGLPELTLEIFEQLNLEEYSWIHFEGRNTDVVLPVIQYIQSYNNSLNSMSDRMPITISAEFENPRLELMDLLPYVDVAFVSKDFVKNLGFNNMSEVIHNIDQDIKNAIICAWAEEGAIARTPCGAIVQSPAFPPEKVIDTLGAGDTFNAAVIYYLNKSKVEFMRKYEEEAASTSDTNQTDDNVSDNGTAVKRDIEKNLDPESLGYDRLKFITETVLQKAIKIGCRIAGAKVGLRGYDNLDVISSDIL